MHSNTAVFARHDDEYLHSQQSEFTMNQGHNYEQLLYNTLNFENSDVPNLTVHDSEKEGRYLIPEFHGNHNEVDYKSSTARANIQI